MRRDAQGVVQLFGLLLGRTGMFDRQWGRLLANLKDDREAGDYEALSYLDEATAYRSVREAAEFISAVEPYVGALPTS